MSGNERTRSEQRGRRKKRRWRKRICGTLTEKSRVSCLGKGTLRNNLMFRTQNVEVLFWRTGYRLKEAGKKRIAFYYFIIYFTIFLFYSRRGYCGKKCKHCAYHKDCSNFLFYTRSKSRVWKQVYVLIENF